MHEEYITRDGKKAVVLTKSAPGLWPWVGYVEEQHFDTLICHAVVWKADGRMYFNTDGNFDLVTVSQKEAAE